jgi:hypothetical protein
MPRTPSGKTITHSSFPSMCTQFSGVPTSVPPRAAATLSTGMRGIQYSPIPRAMRGGSASSNSAVESIRPSNGSCPAWLATTSTRPAGTCSMPTVSTRK